MRAPHHLRAEHLGAAVLGLGERRPRLSWQLPVGTRLQVAYQIEIDGRAQAQVESSDSVLVPWPGADLGSRARVEWRVKVWTDAGESDWSLLGWFETGLLDPVDWVARWTWTSRAGARLPARTRQRARD